MFGYTPYDFSDKFDVGKVTGAGRQAEAKLKADTFLKNSAVGGAGLTAFAKNKAGNIMRKANASAQSTANNAAGISGLFNAAGSIGMFGAGGGFGGGGVPGDGGAAAGMTTPWDKGYSFFESGTPSFGGDYTYDFSKSYFP